MTINKQTITQNVYQVRQLRYMID